MGASEASADRDWEQGRANISKEVFHRRGRNTDNTNMRKCKYIHNKSTISRFAPQQFLEWGGRKVLPVLDRIFHLTKTCRARFTKPSRTLHAPWVTASGSTPSTGVDLGASEASADRDWEQGRAIISKEVFHRRGEIRTTQICENANIYTTSPQFHVLRHNNFWNGEGERCCPSSTRYSI